MDGYENQKLSTIHYLDISKDSCTDDKGRKLTTDSGFCDESVGKDNYVTAHNINHLDTDSPNLSRRGSNTSRFEYGSDDSMQESTGDECVGSPRTGKKKKRQRRMTPVPKNVPISKVSERRKKYSKNKFISLEEEDAVDVEQFTAEVDFICPCEKVKSWTAKHLLHRNSWHGVTEEEASEYKSYEVALLAKSKSKSLAYFRTKKEKITSAYKFKVKPTFNRSLSDSYLESDTNTSNDEEGDECCFSSTESNIRTYPENASTFHSLHRNDQSKDEAGFSESENLPLWMREAEVTMTSSTADSEANNDDEAISKKLDIPTVNWKKMDEEHIKISKIWSNQRKQFMKDRNSPKMRQRKITPSKAPTKYSLEQLANFKQKTTASDWSLTEEEEEEEMEGVQ